MKRTHLALFLCTALAFASACTPTREDYRDDIAEADCRRAEECGKFGPKEKYSSYDDCFINRQDDYNDFWPADECGEGQMNQKVAESCITRVEVQSCSSNFFDGLSFVNDCNADKVCTEPRQ